MAHTRLLGRVALGSLAIALTLAAAGCGNRHTGPGYANGSTGGLTYSDKELGKDQIMRVAYAAAVRAGTAHVTLRMTGRARLSAEGDVTYGKAQPSMSMTVSMPQMGKGHVEMRYVDKVLYLQIPGIAPAGKFVAIDKKSSLAKSFGGSADQMDPLKDIRALQSAVHSSERVGKQTMDGVTVEHYKLTVDTATLFEQLGQPNPERATMPKTVTYDLWLDERQRLHRTSFATMGTRFDAAMSRWGEPVHIEKPTRAQLITDSVFIGTVPGA